jgi:hypothetical protein
MNIVFLLYSVNQNIIQIAGTDLITNSLKVLLKRHMILGTK